MLLSSVFARFVDQKPFCIMARGGALERMLSATRLDALFDSMAVVQYERKLLFSQLVEWIGRVVTRVDRSVLKSCEAMQHELNVSDEAVSQKLRGTETRVPQALVRDSFREARAVLEQLKVLDKSWVRGRRTGPPFGIGRMHLQYPHVGRSDGRDVHALRGPAVAEHAVDADGVAARRARGQRYGGTLARLAVL